MSIAIANIESLIKDKSWAPIDLVLRHSEIDDIEEDTKIAEMLTPYGGNLQYLNKYKIRLYEKRQN